MDFLEGVAQVFRIGYLTKILFQVADLFELFLQDFLSES